MWVETRIVSIPGFGQSDFNQELIYRQGRRGFAKDRKGEIN